MATPGVTNLCTTCSVSATTGTLSGQRSSNSGAEQGRAQGPQETGTLRLAGQAALAVEFQVAIFDGLKAQDLHIGEVVLRGLPGAMLALTGQPVFGTLDVAGVQRAQNGFVTTAVFGVPGHRHLIPLAVHMVDQPAQVLAGDIRFQGPGNVGVDRKSTRLNSS